MMPEEVNLMLSLCVIAQDNVADMATAINLETLKDTLTKAFYNAQLSNEEQNEM
jgi:hypothetical protein